MTGPFVPDPASPNLSSAGLAARREQMLGDLKSHMVRRVRRRRVVRTSAASCALLLLIAASYWALAPRAVPNPAPPDQIATAPTPPPAPPPVESAAPAVTQAAPPLESARVVIQTMFNSPGVVDRYAVASSTTHIAALSDAELQASLRNLGMEDGLIRTEGKLLLARDVVRPDPALAPSGPQSSVPVTAGAPSAG